MSRTLSGPLDGQDRASGLGPHSVRQDGQFASNGHDGVTTTLGAHQAHAP